MTIITSVRLDDTNGVDDGGGDGIVAMTPTMMPMLMGKEDDGEEQREVRLWL